MKNAIPARGVSRLTYERDSLRTLQRECHELAVEKGFWEESRSFGDIIALIHTEVSEAYEAWRSGCGETEIHKSITPEGIKPEGVPVELADAVIRIFDWCEANDIDLTKIIRAKLDFNRRRPWKHGGKRT